MNDDRTVRFLNIREVEALTRLSPTTINRLEKHGAFPRRRRPRPRRIFWLESEILDFLKSSSPGRRNESASERA
jgi:predicted DNA-binding transcriptional regulator AlpA